MNIKCAETQLMYKKAKQTLLGKSLAVARVFGVSVGRVPALLIRRYSESLAVARFGMHYCYTNLAVALSKPALLLSALAVVFSFLALKSATTIFSHIFFCCVFVMFLYRF